jgi:hypothetical protein
VFIFILMNGSTQMSSCQNDLTQIPFYSNDLTEESGTKTLTFLSQSVLGHAQAGLSL